MKKLKNFARFPFSLLLASNSFFPSWLLLLLVAVCRVKKNSVSTLLSMIVEGKEHFAILRFWQGEEINMNRR